MLPDVICEVYSLLLIIFYLSKDLIGAKLKYIFNH